MKKWLIGSSCILIIGFVLVFLKPVVSTMQRSDASSRYDTPKSRELNQAENQELTDIISKRFRISITKETKFRGAGSFRFVGSPEFFCIDRTDVHSIAFERPDYGDPYKTANSQLLDKETLLKRIETVLRENDLDVPGRRFAEFQDEFAGAVQPAKISKDFDPRKGSRLVARTVNFDRVEGGIPYFGSELLIGLNSDGNIGRFRRHWPTVDPAIIQKARELQRAVRAGQWKTPSEFRGEGIEILDVTPGVGHSSFADLGFRADAVVRVTVHKTAKGTQYPLSSTSYKYFDAAGREVRFSSFPQGPATSRDQKKDK